LIWKSMGKEVVGKFWACDNSANTPNGAATILYRVIFCLQTLRLQTNDDRKFCLSYISFFICSY
jgi:hypothetical protein